MLYKCFPLLIFLLISFNAYSQVENYSLELEPEGEVDLRVINELNQLQEFTLQFWVNPSEWNSQSAIYKRGEGDEEFSARLSSANTIKFVSGNNVIELYSSKIGVDKWSHITILYNGYEVELYVNNELKQTEIIDFYIPDSFSSFYVGGEGFAGRIDELRIWSVAIEDTFFHLWRNTVNKHHPNWDNLIAYYKFDQELCDNIVDYKFNYHGIFSSDGVTRSIVDDNEYFVYRKSVAYTNFARWSDRQIDSDKYLLANDLIILDLQGDPSGEVTMPYPYNEGTIVNGERLDSFNGREGVLSLNGDGSYMNVGPDVLNPTERYAFSTWIYIEEWDEGAYIFRKERNDDEGFSIRLGNEDQKRVLVRVNGVDYSRINQMETGTWIHLGVTAFSTTKNQVYQVTFNGEPTFAVNNDQEDNDYKLSGIEDVDAFVGYNINAKFDETVIWNSQRSSQHMSAAMEETPMPGPDRIVEAHILRTVDSYWNYNDKENPGYDSYSYKHFVNLMRAHYDGYRGYTIRMGILGFEGWQQAISDPSFRETFALQMAEIAEEFDGIDLDFEWCYSAQCWDDYGKTIAAVKDQLPEGKILTVTPHYVSWQLPQGYMDDVDYFPFQIYGPNNHVFHWSTYLDAYDRFISHGYSKDKIVMSYATTTSRGYDPQTNNQLGAAPIGVRNGLLDGDYHPGDNSAIDANGYLRYFTGYNQVIDRAEFVQDNNLGGIMYWDMGNDVKTSHPYSLAKAASYSINSNVDTLVTEVDLTPVSISKVDKQPQGVKIFPNPASDYITILNKQEKHIEKIEFIDLSGRKVKSVSQAGKIDVADLNKGVYVLNIYLASDMAAIKVIIE
ncbi:glycosyl hydrolase family 18 protein [Marinilabiliaceae bacterium ANBcel2]|nr:glycosyl hydrolase family 18 protein [Marinilabiliaceae bacterium ANBcel2]